jgi:hypothetical protein
LLEALLRHAQPRPIAVDPELRGHDAVVERRHDHLDPELEHDLLPVEDVLLRAHRRRRSRARGRGREPVEQRVDVAGGEGGGAAAQKLAARELRHRPFRTSFDR